jgi:uncharacterized protein YegP (UPF0339 family)
MDRKIIVNWFRRTDGKWAWHAKTANGEIVATDGGQGYENKSDALDAATLVTGIGIRSDVQFVLQEEGRVF